MFVITECRLVSYLCFRAEFQYKKTSLSRNLGSCRFVISMVITCRLVPNDETEAVLRIYIYIYDPCIRGKNLFKFGMVLVFFSVGKIPPMIMFVSHEKEILKHQNVCRETYDISPDTELSALSIHDQYIH